MRSVRASVIALPAVGLLGLVSLVALADTHTVAPPGTVPPADFTTIQEAIDFASDGDEIEVEPGTYAENVDFLGKAIAVHSTGGADVTIVDGSACTTGPETCSVVVFASGEGQDSVLDGFTLTGGHGTVPPGPSGFRGGGIHCNGASPTILNCTISGNDAGGGGGVFLSVSDAVLTGCTISDNTSSSLGGGLFTYFSSSPTVTDCVVIGNSATSGGGGVFNSGTPTLVDCAIADNETQDVGGGVYNIGYPTFLGCTIDGNTAATNGGGIWNFSASAVLANCQISGNSARSGGGIHSNILSSTLTNCEISGNSAEEAGGGICSVDGSSPTLIDCTISGNTAAIGGGMCNHDEASAVLAGCLITGNTATVSGGGIYNGDFSAATLTACRIGSNVATESGAGMANVQSSPVLTNCTIHDNTTPGNGGAIHNLASAPILTHCTVVGNSADGGGGGLFNTNGGVHGSESAPTVTNGILWANAPDAIVSQGSSATVTFTDVEGGYPGTGNIDLDPELVDPTGGDHHLQPGSPCIDSGTAAPPGGLPPTDADGDPRVICGLVDMGADEAPEPPDGCAGLFIRGDCNFDLVVEPLADAIFLLDFGFAGGMPPPCLSACDADDSGSFSPLLDGFTILALGFGMGEPPPAPYPLCGSDPTPDDLTCDSWVGCP